MSKKLSIKEWVDMLLDDYNRLVDKAEKAEAEVKRLTFALEETQAALEGVVNDVDYGNYLKEYNDALTRAEMAEDLVAELKQKLLPGRPDEYKSSCSCNYAAFNRAKAAEAENKVLKQQLADVQLLDGLSIGSWRAKALSLEAQFSKPRNIKQWNIKGTQVAELERLRMQLAACSVAASQNTDEAVKLRLIDSNNPRWSLAYSDICAAVDREIALRKEVDQLLAKIIYAESNPNQYKKAYKLLAEYSNFERNSWKLILDRREKRIAELEALLQETK
jgi:hypothetical protein